MLIEVMQQQKYTNSTLSTFIDTTTKSMKLMTENIQQLTLNTEQIKHGLKMSDNLFHATSNEDRKPVEQNVMHDHMEIYIDNEIKLKLHGLCHHYIKSIKGEKHQPLIYLLDKIKFNQVVIFIKSQFHTRMLTLRYSVLRSRILNLQRYCRGYLARPNYSQKLNAILILQSEIRRHVVQKQMRRYRIEEQMYHEAEQERYEEEQRLIPTLGVKCAKEEAERKYQERLKILEREIREQERLERRFKRIHICQICFNLFSRKCNTTL